MKKSQKKFIVFKRHRNVSFNFLLIDLYTGIWYNKVLKGVINARYKTRKLYR